LERIYNDLISIKREYPASHLIDIYFCQFSLAMLSSDNYEALNIDEGLVLDRLQELSGPDFRDPYIIFDAVRIIAGKLSRIEVTQSYYNRYVEGFKNNPTDQYIGIWLSLLSTLRLGHALTRVHKEKDIGYWYRVIGCFEDGRLAVDRFSTNPEILMNHCRCAGYIIALYPYIRKWFPGEEPGMDDNKVLSMYKEVQKLDVDLRGYRTWVLQDVTWDKLMKEVKEIMEDYFHYPSKNKQ
jgi:hypothetical protein